MTSCAALGATGRSKVAPAIQDRVARAAERALAERRYVSPIDVLIGLGWLAPSHVDAWRQGRVADLESLANAGLDKLSAALRALGSWAEQRGLRPSETAYVARTRDRRQLQFSRSGDPSLERAYRTHWISPALSDRQRERLTERASRPPDLVVISPLAHDWVCAGCGGSGGLLIMEPSGPLCLGCADLDHLAYLPRGDAALTRRAKAGSGLTAVVVRFSRARKRYERQGILVEEAALEEAERQCLADAEARARRCEREDARGAAEDAELEARIAAEIHRLFPACPTERAAAISRHAAARGSGRIGRAAAARGLDRRAIELAVIASIRHLDTGYDALLMSGVERDAARAQVQSAVVQTLDAWRRGQPDTGSEASAVP
ncbi:MAG: DUF2293 domain-containing protein [Candidatus Limnocylindrales bacterium]